MKKNKLKKEKPKRKKNLESNDDIIKDFMIGMKEDDTVAGDNISLLDDSFMGEVKGIISSCCATLDAAIGIGGAPFPRIIILHGKEGSGKSTVALTFIAEAQRMGGIGYFIDKEYKLDTRYAKKIGVDTSRCATPAPKTIEGVLAHMKACIKRAREIRSKTKRIVPVVLVIDSLSACKAWETIETPSGKRRYPAEPRIWSEELPDIVHELASENILTIFTSQVRKKMNVKYGNDEELAGGNAPRFYASLVIYFKKIGTEKDSKKNKIASIVEAECRKNQHSPPFRKAKFSIFWDRGIDYEYSLVLQLESMGLVKKISSTKERKAGFYIGKINLGLTRLKAADKIRDNEKLRNKLISIFYNKMEWDLPEYYDN